VLTLVQDNGGWNINSLQFTTTGGSATVSITPASVTFASQQVNTTSPAQPLTVRNTGTVAASVTSVAASGDFTQSNTCGSSIPANGSCTVNVTFTPTATGTRTGTVTVTSSATNSPATVSLSGTGTSGGPFGGTPAAIPGVVQAENYDLGGQGVGYSVSSVNGTGNGYRADGVDLESTSDTGGGLNVGWTSGGQWFKYTVSVASAGTYSVALRVAAPSAVTGALHLADTSGTNLSGAVSIPASGGWQTWTTVNTQVTLPAGQQVLTLVQDNGGWNINSLQFTTTGATNLAAGKPTSESSHNQVYGSGNVTDGNQTTYWESTNNVFPQWVQVDLGSAQSVSRIVLQLPASWGGRDQTLSVLASVDGTNFTTVKASATYTFTPTANNTVTITLPATSQRYWRVQITANTGWPAGQVSELQIWNQ
jgi:hypothetical protein